MALIKEMSTTFKKEIPKMNMSKEYEVNSQNKKNM